MSNPSRGLNRRLSAAIKLLPLFPAIVLSWITIGTVACGGHGLFGLASPTDSSSSTVAPTPTPVPGTSNFAYVTNLNDGSVSEYARNTNTGVLTPLATATITAGSASGVLGPEGIAIDSTNSFAFVANSDDGNIYQFTINAKNGKLKSNGSISNGAASKPQLIAISTDNSFLWVTSSGTASVNAYAIDSGTGKLSKVSGGILVGFANPFGIAVHPNGSFLFVTDPGSGLIYSFTINADGTLSQNGSAVTSASFGLGAIQPEIPFVDPSGATLWVTDGALSVVSPFTINANGTLAAAASPPMSTGNVSDLPIGLAIAETGAGELLFTANQGTGTVSMFLVSGTALTLQTRLDGLSAPTQAVVDSLNEFVYTTDQTADEVTQAQPNGACGVAPILCGISSAATGHAPFWIALTH